MDTQQQEITDNSYEAINVIEAWRLNYCLGRAIEYIADSQGLSTDSLEKAVEYITREIEARKKAPRIMRKARGQK